MEGYGPYYAQVLGIGVIWITVHCIGMCGPIMASLTAGMGVNRAKSRGGRARRALMAVGAYQGGRGLIYGAMGAMAGLLGAAAQATIESVAQTAGLAVAVVILGVGVAKISPFKPWRRRGGQGPGWAARFTSKALRGLGRHLPREGLWRMVGFGLVLGFLPCMLMFWVLGIAAATASAFHGAAIMVLLVVLTTPVLAMAAMGSSLPGWLGHLGSDRVLGAAMVFSGVWLLLIAMAANGWMEHAHWPIAIGDRELVIMLW